MDNVGSIVESGCKRHQRVVLCTKPGARMGFCCQLLNAEKEFGNLGLDGILRHLLLSTAPGGYHVLFEMKCTLPFAIISVGGTIKMSHGLVQTKGSLLRLLQIALSILFLWL